MARINDIVKEIKNIRIQDIVKATYTINEIDGERIFQINTYGTKMRKKPSESSQIIQLDKKTANKLVEILKEEFSI